MTSGSTEKYENPYAEEDRMDAFLLAYTALAPAKKCPRCKQTGGPWPDGNRPKSTAPLQSGCPRCGWCA